MSEPTPGERIETIFQALRKRGHSDVPIREAMELALAHPEAIADLVETAIERLTMHA